MGGRGGWDGVVSSAGSRGRQRRDGVAVAARRGAAGTTGVGERQGARGRVWGGWVERVRGRTREETVGSLPAV